MLLSHPQQDAVQRRNPQGRGSLSSASPMTLGYSLGWSPLPFLNAKVPHLLSILSISEGQRQSPPDWGLWPSLLSTRLHPVMGQPWQGLACGGFHEGLLPASEYLGLCSLSHSLWGHRHRPQQALCLASQEHDQWLC